jgi:hypothetical protein
MSTPHNKQSNEKTLGTAGNTENSGSAAGKIKDEWLSGCKGRFQTCLFFVAYKKIFTKSNISGIIYT